jgi:hypothetical protein
VFGLTNPTASQIWAQRRRHSSSAADPSIGKQKEVPQGIAVLTSPHTWLGQTRPRPSGLRCDFTSQPTRAGQQHHIQDLLKCRIPKTTRKAPSGVRTSSPATNGIAAFAVTASCIRRWYANTLLMSTTRPCHQACMSTSRAQFGSERNSHRRLRAASSKRRRLRRLLGDSERFRSAPRKPDVGSW